MSRRGVKVPITAEDQTKAAFQSAANNAKRFDDQLQRTGRAAQGTTRQFRSMRGATGQLGFQIQDIAVQLQSGQNALLVFGQQGSQIASIFGPGGAVVGAVLAVSAAIGTALLPTLFESETAVEDLEAALAAVDKVARITDDGILILSESMAKLAEASRDAVGVQLAAAVIQAEAAVAASIGAIQEKFESEFGGFLEPSVQTAIDQFQEAEKAGLKFSDIMRAGMVPATNETERLRHEVGELKNEIVDISQEMGISEQSAYDLLAAFSAMQDGASPETIQAFLDTVVDIPGATGAASDKLRELQANLIEAQQAAARAQEALDALKQAEDSYATGGVLPPTGAEDEAANDPLGSIEDVEQDMNAVWTRIFKQRTKANKAGREEDATEETSYMDQLLAIQTTGASKASKIQQKLSLAKATMAGIESIQQAWALPFPANIPAAAFAAATMAGNLAAIQAASFEGGGFTGVGPRAGGMDGKGGKLAMLHPNEVVTDMESNDGRGGMGGGALVFNVNANDAKSFNQMLSQNRGYVYGMIDQYWRRKGRRA